MERRRPLPLLISLWIFLSLVPSKAAEIEATINQWLAHQTNIQSWSAGFTQTRKLKALTQPLVSTGQVWFAAPQNFRWELGSNQTIAIRNDNLMLVVYPRLKRAEKYDFNSLQNNQWKDTLGLLQSGFPRSRDELSSQFKILSLNQVDGLHQLALEPRSPQARKMMPQINIYLATNSPTLQGTELVFADGSSMRNIFHNVQINLPPPADSFSVSLPSDFKLVEPLRNAK